MLQFSLVRQNYLLLVPKTKCYTLIYECDDFVTNWGIFIQKCYTTYLVNEMGGGRGWWGGGCCTRTVCCIHTYDRGKSNICF